MSEKSDIAIQAAGLTKQYRVYRKREGLAASLRPGQMQGLAGRCPSDPTRRMLTATPSALPLHDWQSGAAAPLDATLGLRTGPQPTLLAEAVPFICAKVWGGDGHGWGGPGPSEKGAAR